MRFTVMAVTVGEIGTLSKPRRQRQRQRERHETKGLMSKTTAVHVRYKSLYISLPFSANYQLRILKNLGHDCKYFGFLFGIDRWHYIFSLSRFLDRFAL